jgi:2-polyprenyl-3-methyl-5-hydroxy-6-metoxy-1,4-benzoquinol methylase
MNERDSSLDQKHLAMKPAFTIEDLGGVRRLHTVGPHTHEAAKDAPVCHECQLDLPFSAKFIQQLIDWDATGLFHFIGERLFDDSFNEAPRNMIERYRPDLSGQSVLDFGSGLGQLTPFFFERGAARVSLAEIDPQLLALSRTYLGDLGLADRCEFSLVSEDDALEMYESDGFDLIVTAEVFEHILPRHRVRKLQLLYSKLKPGGTLVITTPNRLFPLDTHTTGLWFAAWFPAPIGAWYARTFSAWRWKGRSTEDLLRQGLRQYSYFEARKVLKPLGARDLCRERPLPAGEWRKGKSLKAQSFYRAMRIAHVVVLQHIGPWEAWMPTLEMAWGKPRA